jgi:hypothetical protein
MSGFGCVWSLSGPSFSDVSDGHRSAQLDHARVTRSAPLVARRCGPNSHRADRTLRHLRFRRDGRAHTGQLLEAAPLSLRRAAYRPRDSICKAPPAINIKLLKMCRLCCAQKSRPASTAAAASYAESPPEIERDPGEILSNSTSRARRSGDSKPSYRRPDSAAPRGW